MLGKRAKMGCRYLPEWMPKSPSFRAHFRVFAAPKKRKKWVGPSLFTSPRGGVVFWAGGGVTPTPSTFLSLDTFFLGNAWVWRGDFSS